MRIQSISLNSVLKINYAKQQTNNSFIQPLKADTVSFGSVDDATKRDISLWIDGKLNMDEAVNMVSLLEDAEIREEYFNQLDAKRTRILKSKPKEMLEYIGKKSFDECSGEEILKSIGIKVKKNRDGYIISHYEQPDDLCSFADIGIDEKEKFDEIFKNLIKIKKDADFEKSSIEELPKLREIGGKANFSFSKIKNLSSLEKVGGRGDFDNTDLTEMPKLSYIGGKAYFYKTEIKSFPMLRYVGSSADFSHSKTESLPSLEKVGKILDISFSNITNLPKLKKVGYYVYACHNQLDNPSDLWAKDINVIKVPFSIQKIIEEIQARD